MVEYIGRSGYVGGYRLVVGENRVQVIKDGVVLDHPVPARRGVDVGGFVARARDLRVGWGRLPTGDEVIAVFDDADHDLGYVIDLTDEALSGWGEVPASRLTVTELGGAGSATPDASESPK